MGTFVYHAKEKEIQDDENEERIGATQDDEMTPYQAQEEIFLKSISILKRKKSSIKQKEETLRLWMYNVTQSTLNTPTERVPSNDQTKSFKKPKKVENRSWRNSRGTFAEFLSQSDLLMLDDIRRTCSSAYYLFVNPYFLHDLSSFRCR